MVAIAGFTKDQILSAVREMYSEVANLPSKQFHFPTGRSACLFVGYPEDLLDRLPASAVESFAGVGFPFRADVIRPGDRVLDIGAGSGTDTLIAARVVGPQRQGIRPRYDAGHACQASQERGAGGCRKCRGDRRQRRIRSRWPTQASTWSPVMAS